MQYGSDVVLSGCSIRVSHQRIESIGIGDGTECWGVWFPPPDEECSRHLPEHLVVSALHPRVWPVLVDIKLKIFDSDGTASEAFAVLRDLGVDVVSHHTTPTGHRHATLAVLGAMPKLLDESGLQGWHDRNGRNRCDTDVRKDATLVVATPILRAVYELRSGILAANAERKFPFLHPRYTNDHRGAVAAGQGLAFDPDLLLDSDRDLADNQIVSAATTTWLQYPAFFWLYGKPEHALRMEYQRKTEELKIAAEFKEPLNKILSLGGKNAGVRTVACVDTDSYFLRIMPNRDAPRLPWRIWVEFQCEKASGLHPSGDRSLQGLVAAITQSLLENGASLWHTSTRIIRVGGSSEAAELCFWASPTSELSSDDAEDRWLKNIRDAIESEELASKVNAPVSLKVTKYRKVGVHTVFVSTKSDWFSSDGGDVQRSISSELERLGMNMEVSMGRQCEREGHPRHDAIEKIRKSSGFIQVLPKDRGEIKKQGWEWLMFELGIAIAMGLPRIVLVDGADDDFTGWKNAYHGLLDEDYMDSFDSFRSFGVVDGQIRNAVQELDRMIRDRDEDLPVRSHQ